MFDEIKAKYFPSELIPGITAKSVEAETIRQIWNTISHQVFSPLTELGNYARPEERRQRSEQLNEIYKTTHKEHIVFYNEANEPIGWFYGMMVDPSTFFMSWSGILPAYQRRGIYSEFLKLPSSFPLLQI